MQLKLHPTQGRKSRILTGWSNPLMWPSSGLHSITPEHYSDCKEMGQLQEIRLWLQIGTGQDFWISYFCLQREATLYWWLSLLQQVTQHLYRLQTFLRFGWQQNKED
jgi:hypothetical protein